MKEIYKWVSNK